MALSCKGISLQDNYWVRLEGDTTSWTDEDIRQNKLNHTIAQVALHGASLTLMGMRIHRSWPYTAPTPIAGYVKRTACTYLKGI